MSTYPNQFARIGISDAAVLSRLSDCFSTIFFSPENNFYHQHPTDPDAACMVDTGNNDARTEGMSYGMMMCVQMNRKDLFDKLWTFSMRYMHLSSGVHQGYFAWSVQLDGKHNAEGPAPDGEEYFAMALLMASARWGDGEGIFAYRHWAQDILRHCVHQAEMVEGGQPMWNPENHYIKFVPGMEISDPSYHLPHFYEVFAEEADEEDRPFWHEAAAASRRYLQAACDERTGMNAEYADYDGKPHVDESNHWHFYSDAYRTAANIGLDAAWNGPQEVLCDRVAALQRFFLTHDRTSVYAIDGTAVDEVVLHPVGFLAATAQGALAAVHSAQPDAEHNAREWVRMLWNTPMRTGTRRYYDNFLYAFAMLALSGKYRYE